MLREIFFKMYTGRSVRKLVDKFFSLQWCRDNLVVPLYEETSLPVSQKIIKIAIANYSYLGTLAGPIQERLSQAGYSCEFIQRSQEEIQEILDLASDERFISADSIELSEFDEDDVLEAIKATSDIDEEKYDFEFEFEEEYEEEEVQDLAVEMLESKLQNAAGAILIHSRKNNLSDIYIEPRKENYKIRVREDGMVQNFMVLPRKEGIQLVTCLKNMALMDIAEKRAPQDGKIIRKFEENIMEFRCGTVPNIHGEKMIIRVLSSDTSLLNLDTLINVESVRKKFREIINTSSGMVIVSGPTGSGKSTTIASALREKDNGKLNIVTAEDPVEYELGGSISQSQVNRAKGQTFASMLRTFLRHDPDVILIGESRDPETVEASLDAAETGHLVFTTLHANSSVSSLMRLLDMEIPKYKLNYGIKGVLAQRLIRKVCSGCAAERFISENESIEFGIDEGTSIKYANALSPEEKANRKEEGSLCLRCNGSGYKGRVGIYELLEMNIDIQTAISEGKNAREIKEIAINKNSIFTLREYGVELIKEGITTISELKRTTDDIS